MSQSIVLPYSFPLVPQAPRKSVHLPRVTRSLSPLPALNSQRGYLSVRDTPSFAPAPMDHTKVLRLIFAYSTSLTHMLGRTQGRIHSERRTDGEGERQANIDPSIPPERDPLQERRGGHLQFFPNGRGPVRMPCFRLRRCGRMKG